MDKENLSVLVIALIFSLSGILINLIKKGNNEKIKLIQDNASLFWFRVLVPIALLFSLGFYFSGIGSFSFFPALAFLGYLLILFGLLTRWFAIISLGNAFTVKVSILENHRLKTDGIYKWIRHPSYTGLLVYYLGLGFVMHNWICIFILILFPMLAVFNRIKVEEKVLMENFPKAYEAYRKSNWGLFPFVF